MAVRVNARPGQCGSCGKEVAAGDGFSYLDPDRGWSVSCSDAGCRSLCGTAPPLETRVLQPGEQVALSRKANEVFGLARIAVLKNDERMALQVCQTLVELDGYYTLFGKAAT
jgi:hypothetical protein